MIICPNCGKDNELGRIFCLSCGAKLDLNAIAAPTSAKNPSIRKARRALQATMVNALIKSVKLFFLAASAAFISLLFLPPDFVRYRATPQDGDEFDNKKFQLSEAVNSATSASIKFSEVEVNGMLKQHVKALNDNFKSPIKIGSIYASLGNDVVTVAVDRKWLNFHVFLVFKVKPVLKNGKFVFEPVGGAIGRFPLPSAVVPQYVDVFKPLWKRFEFDKQTLDQVSSIEVKPKFVTVTCDPNAVASPAPGGPAPAPATATAAPATNAAPPASGGFAPAAP